MSRLLTFLYCCFLFASALPAAAHRGADQDFFTLPDRSLSGQLLDAQTGAPLPYVSLGFTGHPAGTMTDSRGTFTLLIREAYLDRNLKFSLIGYQAREIPVRQLFRDQAAKGKVEVRLEASSKALAEVQVKGRNKRFVTQLAGSQIGKLTPFRHTFENYTYPIDQVKGPELGVKIQARKYPAYLQNLNFCLSGTGAEITRVRFKVYSLRNDLPHKEMFQQIIQVDVPPKFTGWIETDLRPYHLMLNQDFVVALEWLRDEHETKKSWLASGLVFSPKKPDYYKAANQDQWQQLRQESVGLYVTLLYQK